MAKKKPSARCPCGWDRPFGSCCAPLLRRQRAATTAEELMRSRYVAFVKGNRSYVEWSWHPNHRPPDVGAETGVVWEPLDVLALADGGADDPVGTVEFRTGYRIGARTVPLHEVSMFARIDDATFGDRWVYVTGSAPDWAPRAQLRVRQLSAGVAR